MLYSLTMVVLIISQLLGKFNPTFTLVDLRTDGKVIGKQGE